MSTTTSTTPLFDVNAEWALRGVNNLKRTQLNALFPQLVPQPHFLLQTWDYAEARGLDVFSGHVHAAVYRDSEYRDGREFFTTHLNVMPTIHGYRHIAHASGKFAGMDAPIYGPMMSFGFNGVEVTAPEWIEMTVYVMNSGVRCPVTRRERFIENVVLDHNKNIVSIWLNRPAGQLAKCTEAQCLRAGFGNCDMYTPDEMMGVDNGHKHHHSPKEQPSALDSEIGVVERIVAMYESAQTSLDVTAASEFATAESRRKAVTATDFNGPIMSAFTAAASRVAMMESA